MGFDVFLILIVFDGFLDNCGYDSFHVFNGFPGNCGFDIFHSFHSI